MIRCTKYRKKVLRERVAERARDLIRQICAARNVVIIRGAVSPDHIHLLLAAPPILAPAKLAQYIKGRSSHHLQSEFPELRKQYWGRCCVRRHSTHTHTASFSLIASFGAWARSCFVPRYRSVV